MNFYTDLTHTILPISQLHGTGKDQPEILTVFETLANTNVRQRCQHLLTYATGKTTNIKKS